MKCPKESLLLKFLDSGIKGELPEDIATHIDQCSLCFQSLMQACKSIGPIDSRILKLLRCDGEEFDLVNPTNRSFSDSLKYALLTVSSDINDEQHSPNRPINYSASRKLDDVTALKIPGLVIQRQVGRGGMGVVFEAFDQGLKRRVALKILRHNQDSKESRDRIKREAEASARLSHPGIVQVYDFGEAEGTPYILLEFVDGPSLAERLAGEPQAPREAALILREIAIAIQYAHEHQVIHRDLKPSNILFQSHDFRTPLSSLQPKITDFGLAKVLDENSQLTQDGQLIGTPAFAAPEQLGRSFGPVTPISDIYSLGAILYTMLTGRAPLVSDELWRTVRMVLEDEPVRPRVLQPSVPLDLETICMRCLMKDSSRRYSTALELAGDLDRFLSNRPILARPVTSAERIWRWVKNNPAVSITSSALVLFFLLTTVGAIWSALHYRELEIDRNTQRIAAEKALSVSRRTTANSLASNGLSWAKEKMFHLASLCYSQAALESSLDDPLRYENVVRCLSNLECCPTPSAILPTPLGVSIDEIIYHESSRWLMLRYNNGSHPPLIWDLQQKSEFALRDDIRDAQALCWSHDGALMLAAFPHNNVALFTFPEQNPIFEMTLDANATVLASSPDNRTFAIACDTIIHLAEVTSDSPKRMRIVSSVPLGESILRVLFSNDGRYLSILDSSLQIFVIECSDQKFGNIVSLEPCDIRGAGGNWIYPSFDANNRLVHYSGASLNWWDPQSSSVIKTETIPPPYFMEVSCDHDEVVVGADKTLIRVTQNAINTFGVDTRVCGCWLSDGSLLSGSAQSDCLVRWTPGFQDGSGWPLFQSDGVLRMKLSPDGKMLTTISATGRVRVWEMPQDSYQSYRMAIDQLYRVEFSNDDELLLAQTLDNKLHVFRFEGKVPIVSIQPPGRLLDAVWCAGDHSILTLCWVDNRFQIDLWDAIKGVRLSTPSSTLLTKKTMELDSEILISVAMIITVWQCPAMVSCSPTSITITRS